MHIISDRRRRTPIPAMQAVLSRTEEGWISLAGVGSGFHDCPLCRELASSSATGEVPAIVEIPRESLPLLARTRWLDDLLELVGPNATVSVMGRDLATEPVEVLSMESFLARLGYD